MDLNTKYIITVLLIILVIICIYLWNNRKDVKENNDDDGTFISNKVEMTKSMKDNFIKELTEISIKRENIDDKVINVYLGIFDIFNDNYPVSALKELDEKVKDKPYANVIIDNTIKFYIWSDYNHFRRIIVNIINEIIVINRNYLTNDYKNNYEIIEKLFNTIISYCNIPIYG